MLNKVMYPLLNKAGDFLGGKTEVGNSLYLDVQLSEKELFEEYGGNVIVLLSIDIKAIIADIKAKQVA